jgi:hypothetical protein
VAQWIQTQASEHLSGAVSEVSGHPSMRHFVQGDGQQSRDYLDRDILKKCI